MENIFSERLLKAMSSQNMTQRELAHRAGITEAAISKYIHDGRTPRADIIANMATVLNTTVDYLLGRDTKDDFDFHKVKNLLARNAEKMGPEQKTELIKILFGEK